MRPNVDSNSVNVYECLLCGSRVEAPEGRSCTACGGELRNLGVSRDL